MISLQVAVRVCPPGAVNIIWDTPFFSRLAAACKAEHGLVADDNVACR